LLGVGLHLTHGEKNNPDKEWNYPVVSVLEKPVGLVYSVRTEKWAYLKYADKGEELYDLENDPDEIKNLLHKETTGKYKSLTARLQKHIPVNPLPAIPKSKIAIERDKKSDKK
ncbi:unnamed protein product, partial [marine sediment metagenome]